MLDYYKFKQIADLFGKGQEDEALLHLAELQHRYVALSDENISYRMQIQEYEDILYLARNLFFDGRFFWLATGPVKQGPFCAECYNRDGLLVRLAGQMETRHCPYCHTPYHESPQYPVMEQAVAVPQEVARLPHEKSVRHKARVIPFRPAQ